ncbi:DUF2085 domain-containing protein [Halocalculus aciditolerans]|uniref:DUF2085 domain-containing protein n=1 Tax=Halocalculus aciditolerans TaxID=1383812 RepID=A0A830FFR5_9EURY|nr:DUF2085 domain-containing protein [Halocalculus aciditolerans]GGL70176.1 hypothetical protein GCM10009039_30240 [Halocalculus aciditolerans]
MGLAAEVRAGLRAARPYLLAHDDPPYDHCHSFSARGRRVDVCARCLGIYPGVAAGFLAGRLLAAPLALVAVLPLPALLDWSAVALGGRDGNNHRRTLTGVLLGVAVAGGVVRLVDGDLRTLAVAAGYGVTTATALWLEHRD